MTAKEMSGEPLYRPDRKVKDPRIAREMAEAEDSYHYPGVSAGMIEHREHVADAVGKEVLSKGFPMERGKIPADVERALSIAISEFVSLLKDPQPDQLEDPLMLFNRDIFEKVDEKNNIVRYELQGRISHTTEKGRVNTWGLFSAEVKDGVVGEVAVKSRTLKT
ncbi:hypothetical protein A3A40_01180 [Candidatus Kaiserbacteria bacterium RIFCSPLOWO2_01_FULL_54_20]|uniref:Uncharacterized protein n=1 Tax=Candidatus Kaiserbacteria bacterium RIFCSPLOWO2_01_FULL_54_20 TaxID=1798513 RepID=A0A1F6EKH1_9BACT|nr:MAG: hypothetical protein A3A40_01180 [Candidatus Kaiserbacteria bacterium RIFCSPLOWO2_01_FULL_54_20]